MDYGLVLGGGGTRGTYHIGAYKALLEMSMDIKIIVGTSIGAINGAIIAQGDFLKLEKIWEDIKSDDILRLPEHFRQNANLIDIKNASNLIREIRSNKGIDSSPLKKLLTEIIDEEKLLKSKTDFSFVTFRVSDKSEVVLSKNELNKGELCDYLLASACFPGFKPVKIKNSIFMDGGFANNIPLSVLADKGVSDIIVIDVGGVGIVKDADVSDKNIITVRSNSPEVGILDFDSDRLKKNTSYGYLDTLRVFGKCVGKKYYFEIKSYYENRGIYGEEILDGLEEAADVLDVDCLKLYTVEELIVKVCTEYMTAQQREGTLELLRNLNEKKAVCTLTKAIISKNAEFLANKMVMSLLGKWYKAANAIAYFYNKIIKNS